MKDYSPEYYQEMDDADLEEFHDRSSFRGCPTCHQTRPIGYYPSPNVKACYICHRIACATWKAVDYAKVVAYRTRVWSKNGVEKWSSIMKCNTYWKPIPGQ